MCVCVCVCVCMRMYVSAVLWHAMDGVAGAFTEALA